MCQQKGINKRQAISHLGARKRPMHGPGGQNPVADGNNVAGFCESLAEWMTGDLKQGPV